MAQTHTGKLRDRAADRGRDQWRRHLTGTGRRIVGRDHLDVHHRHLVHARHPVVVEVRLLDLAILDRDAFGECQPESIDDAALGLGRDVVRLHGHAAIDRAPEVMHSDLPARAIERHFHGAREQRARVVDEGEAQTAAIAAVAILAPVRHAGDRLHHFAGARCVLEEVKPERHRIDSAFHRELVGGEADGAQWRRPHARVLIELLDQLMRDIVAGKVGAIHQDAVPPTTTLVANRVEERGHPISGQAMLPGNELAGCVKARPQIVGRERTEAPVVDVVFARPHHLHGFAGLLRHQHGVDDEVSIARPAPPEAATEQHVVELDLVARNAKRLGGGFLRQALALRPAPDLRRIA